MPTGNADEFKTQIKMWLKSRGIDYLWLAEQCGVSENTVRNWMAKAPIPPLKQKLLRKLIAQLPNQRNNAMDHTLFQVTPSITLNIHMESDVYDRLVLIAHRQGLDVGTMINNMLIETAERDDREAGGASVLLRNRKVVLPVTGDTAEPQEPQGE